MSCISKIIMGLHCNNTYIAKRGWLKCDNGFMIEWILKVLSMVDNLRQKYCRAKPVSVARLENPSLTITLTWGILISGNSQNIIQNKKKFLGFNNCKNMLMFSPSYKIIHSFHFCLQLDFIEK